MYDDLPIEADTQALPGLIIKMIQELGPQTCNEVIAELWEYSTESIILTLRILAAQHRIEAIPWVDGCKWGLKRLN